MLAFMEIRAEETAAAAKGGAPKSAVRAAEAGLSAAEDAIWAKIGAKRR